jgi:hypothetical protein
MNEYEDMKKDLMSITYQKIISSAGAHQFYGKVE